MEEYITREGLRRFLRDIYGNNREQSDIYDEIYDIVNAGYSCSKVYDDEFEYIADLIMEEYGELEGDF